MRRWAAVLALLLALPASQAAGATSHVVDSRGNLLTVESVFALTENNERAYVLRFERRAPDGSTSEEYLAETMDASADLAPQILYDASLDELLLIWLREDEGRTRLASTSRLGPEFWSAIKLLDTGGKDPSSFWDSIDNLSRVHIIWDESSGSAASRIAHRAFDVITLEPSDPLSHPFQPPAPPRPHVFGGPEGGSDEPGPITHQQPDSNEEKDAKGGGSSSFGIVGGCETPVAYRLAGRRLHIATLIGGSWARGDVDLGSSADKSTAEPIVSEIARRFCLP
jgi:hypothetical protein